MDERRAHTLTDELVSHPRTENGGLILHLKGVVWRVLATRVPDPAAIALDEDGNPCVVGVGGNGVVVRLRVTGDAEEEFKIESQRFRLDGPNVKSSVGDDVRSGNLSGGIAFKRDWLFDLGDGRSLRFSTDEAESTPEDLRLQSALAEAAGWPAV